MLQADVPCLFSSLHKPKADVEAGLEALLAVPPGQLLAHWDKLRRALFGGGAGTTVSGEILLL